MSATKATADPLAALILLEKEFPLANTFGAYLLCTFLGCMLFGLTMHQGFRYFRMYPTDILTYRILVVVILAIDLLHTISSVHITYFYLAANYYHPTRLIEGVWSIRLIIAEMGCMILVTHAFHSRRLFLLGGRNVWPVAFIGLFVVAEFALCITAAVESFRSATFMDFEDFTWLVWSILSIAVFVDLMSTSLLIYHLRKSRTGFKKTDSTVDVLMVYGINTGLSTSVLTLVALICAIVMSENLVYSAVLVVSTKMYANSLLAVLNSRRSILDKFDDGSLGLKVLGSSTRDYGHTRRPTHEIEFRLPAPELEAPKAMPP